MLSIRSVQPAFSLSTNLFSPVFSACLAGSVHLFGAGDTPNTGQHLIVDGSAQQVTSAGVLQNTLIEGMAATAEGFLILNGQVAADRYKAQFYRLDGSLAWDYVVPVSRSMARFIQPAVMGQAPVVVWASVGGNTTRAPGAVRDASLASLSIAELASGGSEPARVFPLKGSLTALALATTPHGLLAACDPRGRLELLNLTPKGVTWQLQVEGVMTPISPAMAVCGEVICLAWIIKETLFVQWFDLTGKAISKPQQLAAAPERARLLSTSLFSDGQDHLAITYIQETPTDDWNMLSGEFGRQHRFLPKLAYHESINLLQPGAGVTGAWLPVEPPGLPYHAGCWLEDTFYLLHGEQSPVVTCLQAG